MSLDFHSRTTAQNKTRISLMAAVLLAGGMTFAAAAHSNLQGLYSTDELLDADVYTSAESAKPIGEVEDILLDNHMRVHAVVIETGNFSVETMNSNNLNNLEYRIVVNLSEQEITEQPAYTDTWWNDARQNALDTWEKTKEGASSAWNSTRQATANVLERAEEALKPADEKNIKNCFFHYYCPLLSQCLYFA